MTAEGSVKVRVIIPTQVRENQPCPPGTTQPWLFTPLGFSPSRRTPYKAMFCRISNREGMGILFAKVNVDPR